MCVAELNVSLMPCRHRWYHLSRACSPSTDLSNCDKKLGLAGWEIKCDFCPYCSGWNLTKSEYRLVGNDRAPAIGGLSRTPSLSLNTARRESRRGSLSRTDSSNSIAILAQEKNRALNARVDAYLKVAPEPPLPSPYPAPLADVNEDDGVALSSSPSDTSSEGPESVRHSSTSTQGDSVSIIKRMRHKSKRLSMSLFK
ncbi:hypothetical protein DPSP01_003045 [Paraphaeosphaeria sporulosa]|uniref:Uncharacterized protein n=1 Tax=Paraphaeosphaeria sporulosa TaxID=1460663 RepID=A0A177CKM6_9PLEO|nr:uncharacterized protein CC84DRAFT_1173649 [Paraphaeosphaeria sporulosa]OAG08094.1 hypothetical protein CC84DRAFT_1173649 [Paraphaeosphaeria sporulosa]